MKAKLPAHQEILDRLKSRGVCTDINKRQEEGQPHHVLSVALVETLKLLDFEVGGDAMCLKTGGDGDNGEHLMYLLDMINEDFYPKEEGLKG